MDEDVCDFRTPIGKIIKQLMMACKKPKVDEQLGTALDTFNEKISQQQEYLNNGIFKTDFVEAALFLQSCADLYGKKIDLLWDQLLEFHTRLIEYDCDHEKQKGKNVNQEAISQLEERRNRYKRKKQFKLMLTQNDNSEACLFDKSSDEKLPETVDVFESNDDFCQTWKKFENEGSEIRKISNAVYKQQLKMYRMKNYYIMKDQDFDILDPEDGEFNTKYSRVPGWHHINHLFEYNTKGLLPDKDNIIGTLRLGAYGRLDFLREKKIPFNSPFNQYKEEYMIFKKNFFEEESKKWQNMPLDSFEDLHKQLEYLTQVERANSKFKHNVIPITHTNLTENVIDLEKMIDESDEDSLFELSLNCDADFINSDLYVRLEQLSTAIINTKLRQDSGFFDFDNSGMNENLDSLGAFSDTHTGHNESEEVLGKNAENSTCDSQIDENVNMETLKGSTENATSDFQVGEKDNSESLAGSAENTTTILEVTNTCSENMEVSVENATNGSNNECLNNENTENEFSSGNIGLLNNKSLHEEHSAAENTELDNFETRSILSDHDYCLSPAPLMCKINIEIGEKNNNISCENLNGTKEQTMVPFTPGGCRIIQKVVKLKAVKEERIKRKSNICCPVVPKIRKLSNKQMEKLLRSLVGPVKERKFEKFFSKNYQPQLGEGEIQEVEYESDESDAEYYEELPPVSDQLHSENPAADCSADVASVHDTDDTQSVLSDHNYCQVADKEVQNDSGFVDPTNISALSRNERTDENDTVTQSNTSKPDESPAEVEYQKLLSALKESRREICDHTDASFNGPHTTDIQRSREIHESLVRVGEWRNTINPILRNLKEQDFDIHDYGTRILNSMDINESKLFGSLVEGKSSAEVVRYFISSLQLANTYNIDICGAKKGQLSNDTFTIKLLNKDRYHEHLTEYHAPSEETFRDRLQRMRMMHSKKDNEQEDIDEPVKKQSRQPVTPYKRHRLNVTNKKDRIKPASNLSSADLPTTSDSVNFEEQISHRLQNPSTSLVKTGNLGQHEPSEFYQSSNSRRTTEKENINNLSASYVEKDVLKGKSVIKRQDSQTPRQPPQPSTSWTFKSPTPSSSSSSPLSERCLSTEELFLENFVNVQEQNPHIQLFSTPRQDSTVRFVKQISKSRARAIFE